MVKMKVDYSKWENNSDEWKLALRTLFKKTMHTDFNFQKEVYQGIGKYYQYSAPASLYKFYSDIDLNLESIKNNKMWYSAPCNFNDPFDCDIAIDHEKIFQCMLTLVPENSELRVGSPVWLELKDTVYRQIKNLRDSFTELKQGMGISCLSESYDSLLMWAHYANSHRGICVEYDLLKINKELEFTPVPVIYSNDRICFDSLDVSNIDNISIDIFLDSITTKSLEWSYEKEWRIIRDDQACGDRWDNNKKGALLNMIQPVSITLGCETKLNFEHKIREYCDMINIPLYKMEKDPNHYSLNREES